MPNIKMNCVKTNKGKSKIINVNLTLNIIKNINKTIRDNRKFIRLAVIEEMGIISRGKDTFFIRLALSTIEVVEIDRD
jgi:hypothetical protein